MKRAWLSGIAAALFFLPVAASGASKPSLLHAGDVFELVKVQETKKEGGLGSGSSHDKDTLIERVIAVRPNGVELEYDLPDVTKAQGGPNWQFPARVLKPQDGPAQLLNASALQSGADRWLKEAKLPRSACGHWYFTWNAFQVECDPQSVLKIIAAFELAPAYPREGDAYRDDQSRETGTLKKAAGQGEAGFTVELPVDPDIVRKGRAESDVVIGEIMGKPVSLEEALRKRSQDSVTGTISVRLETDADGRLLRRTRVMKQDVQIPGAAPESETVTETLERRQMSK